MTIMRSNGDRRGGTVRVSVKEFSPSADFLSVNPAAEDRPYWLLSVRDQGVGVPYEIRSKIFDPFFTTKSAEVASGLGLAMVHSIAKQHGGFIEVDSEPGFGADFQVFIPAVEAAPVVRETSSRAARANGGTILVAEDEDVLRSAVAAMLKALGHSSVATSSGQEAVDALAADPERFSAILLDMNMPGLSSELSSSRILEIRPDAPLVLTSGRSPEGAVEALIHAGRAEFLPKPYTIEELGAALDRVLEQAGGDAGVKSAECRE
jgi:CheY-like chemotaxis protein